MLVTPATSALRIPAGGHGVRHDALAHHGGLLDRDADLVDRELRVLGEVARAQHTRRWCTA